MVRKPFRIGEIIRAKNINHLLYIVVGVGYDDIINEPAYNVKVVGVKKYKQWLLEINDYVYKTCGHHLFVRAPKKYNY